MFFAAYIKEGNKYYIKATLIEGDGIEGLILLVVAQSEVFEPEESMGSNEYLLSRMIKDNEGKWVNIGLEEELEIFGNIDLFPKYIKKYNTDGSVEGCPISINDINSSNAEEFYTCDINEDNPNGQE